jgi:uncharacterized repeat protein (TIGR03803 family)
MDGAFYGVTGGGGTSGDGTVFRIAPSGSFKTLFNFDVANGYGPAGALALGKDGKFYGTCDLGGQFSDGTVFSITTVGVLTVLHNFSGADGQYPEGGLMQATNGNVYGTTNRGGSQAVGTTFSISPTGKFRVVHNFDQVDGAFPWGALVQHTNGILYGTTSIDGASGYGTVFSLDLALGPFVKTLLGSGKVGSITQILGQGFTDATAVTFNGRSASFSVVYDTFITAVVPAGATTGPIQVTTPSGILTSNVPFRVVR